MIRNTKLLLLIALTVGFNACRSNSSSNNEQSRLADDEIQVFITTNDRSQDFVKQTLTFNTESSNSPFTIKLD